MRDALAPFMSRCLTGDLRAVAVIGIREDGGADLGFAAEDRDIDRLIGILERLKLEMLTGE